MTDARAEDRGIYGSFEASIARSRELEKGLAKYPGRYRVLTGDRPTGPLHIGHLFGSLENRARLQNSGVEVLVVIADYQVLTDRDVCAGISENVRQLTIDYLATGLDPENGRTFIFPHSHVPELNQLLVPFLTLVTNAELDRNPTVKEEIQASGLKQVNAGTYTYPVHQAADILFCKANVVPVGKDQLPHLEIARTIARRFNSKYAEGRTVFPEPVGFLSEAPLILGLDGSQKMSKSRDNAVALRATEDETARLIKRAKTDVDRHITYDPEKRLAVTNRLGEIKRARILGTITSLDFPLDEPEDVSNDVTGEEGATKQKRYNVIIDDGTGVIRLTKWEPIDIPLKVGDIVDSVGLLNFYNDKYSVNRIFLERIIITI